MISPHGGKLVNRVGTARLQPELPRLEIRAETAQDVENIAKGVYSPLEGFVHQEELESILYKKRLLSDIPWTIPIVLDVSKKEANMIKVNEKVTLFHNNKALAVLTVKDKYTYNKKEFEKEVYGTIDKNHPGVCKTEQMGDFLLGGEIDLINERENPFYKYNLSPIETRTLFEEKGWNTVVGFQTRNVPHLGHESIQKSALTFVDGLFINPVIGKKKKGDFKDEVILTAYEKLMEHYYPRDRVVLSILNFEMRYAGPREAILHAIIRKNFGCTHFIVGRDHAGVGNYYPPFAAQEIFSEFPDLEITPLFFGDFFYCKKCKGVMNKKTCPHSEENHIDLSGTKIREILIEGKIPQDELMRPEVAEAILKFKEPFVE